MHTMKWSFVRIYATAMTTVTASLVAQTAPYDSAKPLQHATLFASGIISTGDYESHPTFMPDGHEVYFLKLAPNFSRWSIFMSRYKNGNWSQPEVAPFSGQYQDADPYITADGKHFYFISDRPIEVGGERQRAASPASTSQQRCRRVLSDRVKERYSLLWVTTQGGQRCE